MVKRRNLINEQFSPRPIAMLESQAYRALSLSAHRIISRIEIELGAHGGNDNGRLPVTKQDFVAYGVAHDQIAPAIREAAALGFIQVQPGRGGNAEHRKPNLFFLTFARGRNNRVVDPPHDWRKIKTIEEAVMIARAARANKDLNAVQFGQRQAAKNRNRSWKPGPKPVLKTGTESATTPVLETRTTGPSRKPGPLSISRVGERSERASSALCADELRGAPRVGKLTPGGNATDHHEQRSEAGLEVSQDRTSAGFCCTTPSATGGSTADDDLDIPDYLLRCRHCGQLGRSADPVSWQDCLGRRVQLHGGCVAAWRAGGGAGRWTGSSRPATGSAETGGR
jgi:hypothetical protein